MKLPWGRSILLVLVVAGTVLPSAHAAPGDFEVIEQLTQVRSAIKKASNNVSCEVPAVKSCSFASLCGNFSSKTQSMYLYTNASGQAVPNYSMLVNMQTVDACLKKPFKEDLFTDPLLNPEKLFTEKAAGGKAQLKENQKRYNSEFARANGIFKDVQKRLIAYLQSQRTADNSAAIEASIRKIEIVSMNQLSLNDEVLLKTGCEMPNAFYVAQTMAVTVCPQFLGLPDASLFLIIAHELSHAIDPCNSSYGYLQSDKGTFILDPRTSMPESEYSEESHKGYNRFADSVGVDEHPFKEAIACLNSPKVMNVQTPSRASVLKRVDDKMSFIQEKDSESGEEKNSDAQMSRLQSEKEFFEKHHKDLQFCGPITGNGHAQEAFADWLAVQIVEKKIVEIPSSADAKRFAFETQAYSFGRSCANLSQAMNAKAKKIMGKKCETVDEALAKAELKPDHDHSHPKMADRVNSIYLANPGLQKALGCVPDKTRNACK
ncbi:MAG: hypothetical protein HUU57_04150 [Bdellovibrio sp.]|nr:hypothetical protein [Bdellovibrio sp.]